MPIRFVLVRLRPGVGAEDYERFIQTVDYPVGPTIKAIRHYRTNRIWPEFKDPARLPWDYMERIEVADKAAYEAELAASTGFAEFRRLNPTFVEETYGFWADQIEPELPSTLST